MQIVLHDAQLAIDAALASHLVFCNVEPPPQLVILLYAVGNATGLYYYHFIRHFSALSSVGSVAFLSALYTATLCISIGIYRVYFHRLRKYPGPAKAALSKWSLVSVDVAGQRPHYITSLHKQYGDLVRTGPRELSLNDPAAIPAMLGASSPAVKGPWYAGVHAGLPKRSLSLHATVDNHDHAARRRIWDMGFKTTALKGYEPMLTKLTTELMLRLEEHVDKEIKIDDWVAFFFFW
jgi:cytochrome P450 family 628